MLNDITQTLPRLSSSHVAAHNNHDPDALMATFAPDALVNDAKREFLGRDAIRAWADKEIFGDNVTLKVERAYDQRGDIVLHARVDGDFDKTNLPDPLILTYYFSIRNDRITQLIIIANKTLA
ncbi:nuclear transport factor 2 family protein [Methylocapsa sp. S129]|uniref:nuclear transport factor 2 family protein n=1 Tax=Methylocapsa sp. S129 TaxID=1641869 RepID=UPI00131E17AD|nr:nuclear transport factor 2 family protein [Methylocapsa sp. S129]